MLEQLAKLGRVGLGALESLGRAHLLLLGIAGGLGSLLLRPRLLVLQTYEHRRYARSCMRGLSKGFGSFRYGVAFC